MGGSWTDTSSKVQGMDELVERGHKKCKGPGSFKGNTEEGKPVGIALAFL